MPVTGIAELYVATEDEESGASGGWIQAKDGLWYAMWSDSLWPEESTAVHHVRRSLWTNMVRDAITNNLQMNIETVSNDQWDAKVIALRLLSS